MDAFSMGASCAYRGTLRGRAGRGFPRGDFCFLSTRGDSKSIGKGKSLGLKQHEFPDPLTGNTPCPLQYYNSYSTRKRKQTGLCRRDISALWMGKMEFYSICFTSSPSDTESRALQLRREVRMVSLAMGAAMMGTMYFLWVRCAQHGGSASGGGLVCVARKAHCRGY